jgi:hypothetical protein
MQPMASVFHSVTTLALAGATQLAANNAATAAAVAVRFSGRAVGARASLLFTCSSPHEYWFGNADGSSVRLSSHE